jgi:pyruvate-ferredoxin/flavodoxin oxidoreductase
LADAILAADQSTDAKIEEQRARVAELMKKLDGKNDPKSKDLRQLAENLVKKSVWIMGGDGWAYDIGYGGLDHVLASGEKVNVLVLDTEVYSNTGGQASKSTPFGATAKFASSGKTKPKKDLAMLAMTYRGVYVAQVAMGANDAQAVKAFTEADQYEGTSIIIAYSPCIEHGYELGKQLAHQKTAVDSGYWPLFRYDPRLTAQGKNPFQLDSKPPSVPLKDYLASENRFVAITKGKDEASLKAIEFAQKAVNDRWAFYEHMAKMEMKPSAEPAAPAPAVAVAAK